MRLLLLFFGLMASLSIEAQNLPLHLLHLPPGFSIEIYAAPIPEAREMTLGAKNIVYVGSPRAGAVYAIIPDPKNATSTRVITIATGLHMPNGVSFKNDSLYVAETNRIIRFDKITENLYHPIKPIVVNNTLPTQQDHGLRYIRFGPDEKLYVGIGAPCNICLSEDTRFATIMRMNADGSNFEIFAKGVRNTSGFDWNPTTQELWFTNTSRDKMGDKSPPDQLDNASVKGMNFGYPYYHGKDVPDPILGNLFPSTDFTTPTYELPAHTTPLGMTFYTGKMFPFHYKNQIFIAEHGSLNPNTQVGYQILAAELTDNHVNHVEPFIYGWLQGQTVWGRPVDTLVMPDGSMLISDDFAGVIYRVTYKQPTSTASALFCPLAPHIARVKRFD